MQKAAKELPLNCWTAQHAEKHLMPPTRADTSSMATSSSHLSSEQSSRGLKTHISNHSVPHKLRLRGKAKRSYTQLWNHAPDPKSYCLYSIPNVDLKHFSSSLMHSALTRWWTQEWNLTRLSYHHGEKGLPHECREPRQGSCTQLTP